MPVDLENVIIPAVQAILGAVAGVNAANVHPYVRVAADDAAFNQLFLDAAINRIHGYTITRENTSVIEQYVGAAKDIHTLVIRGYMGARDADKTETLMQDEIETVRTAFFAKRHLEDQNGNRLVFWCERIAVRAFTYAMFSGALCHYAELELKVHDYPIS